MLTVIYSRLFTVSYEVDLMIEGIIVAIMFF